MSKDSVFEVVETYNDHCDVIEGSSQKWIFKYVLNSHATHFVNIFSIVLDRWVILIIKHSFPDAWNGVLVIHLIIDSVAS